MHMFIHHVQVQVLVFILGTSTLVGSSECRHGNCKLEGNPLEESVVPGTPSTRSMT